MVTGTQAAKAVDNKIMIMKISQLHKTKYDGGSSDEDSDDDALDEDPIFEQRSIRHMGGVNRIRVGLSSSSLPFLSPFVLHKKTF